MLGDSTIKGSGVPYSLVSGLKSRLYWLRVSVAASWHHYINANRGDECAEKIRFYLRNERIRQKIARAGHERCLRSDYSLTRYMREAMQEVLRLRSELTAVPL